VVTLVVRERNLKKELIRLRDILEAREKAG